MKCPHCNGQISPTSNFCEHCGTAIPRNGNPLFTVIATLIVILFSYTCSSNDTKTTPPSKQEFTQNEIEDISFLYEFITANTTGLQKYCESSGYIPSQYIAQFNQAFEKTISTFMPRCDSYLNTQSPEFKSEVEYHILKQIDDDFQSNADAFENKESAVADYCAIYDANANELVQEKIRIFKEMKPNLFSEE